MTTDKYYWRPQNVVGGGIQLRSSSSSAQFSDQCTFVQWALSNHDHGYELMLHSQINAVSCTYVRVIRDFDDFHVLTISIR